MINTNYRCIYIYNYTNIYVYVLNLFIVNIHIFVSILKGEDNYTIYLKLSYTIYLKHTMYCGEPTH